MVKTMHIEENNNELPEGMFVLVKGLSASGEPQYAYVVIAYEKYEAFMDAQAAGAYDLSEFGTIICHGSGQEPPAEVQKEMEEKYGSLDNFERQLIDAIKAAE